MPSNPREPEGYQNGNNSHTNGGSDALTSSSSKQVANTLVTGNRVPEDTAETQKFGLSSKEIISIRNDIAAKLPLLGSNPAIIKLLYTLGFTDVSGNEKNGKLSLGMNEYEIIQVQAQKGPHQDQIVSVIRMANHNSDTGDMFSRLSTALRAVFPKESMTFTLAGLNASVDTHGIYPGFRFADDGRSHCVGRIACTWVDGDGDAVNAPYVGRNRDHYCALNQGDSLNSYLVPTMDDRLDGHSLVASFG